jgi:hypothetical protein
MYIHAVISLLLVWKVTRCKTLTVTEYPAQEPRTNFKLAIHIQTLKIHRLCDWLKTKADHYKRRVTQLFRVLVLH